ARVISPKQAFKEFLNKIGSHVIAQNWNPASGVPVAQFGFRPGPLQRPQIADQQAEALGRTATDEGYVRKLFALLTDKDFELPEGVTGDALIRKKDISP